MSVIVLNVRQGEYTDPNKSCQIGHLRTGTWAVDVLRHLGLLKGVGQRKQESEFVLPSSGQTHAVPEDAGRLSTENGLAARGWLPAPRFHEEGHTGSNSPARRRRV
jgi:hypothetical protein